MARQNPVAERIRRTVNEILEVFRGEGPGKTAALQPVPVQADVPVVVRPPR